MSKYRGPSALEIYEMLAGFGLQRVIRGAAVQHVGPLSASRPAEHFGIRIDRDGVGLLGLERPRRGHE